MIALSQRYGRYNVDERFLKFIDGYAVINNRFKVGLDKYVDAIGVIDETGREIIDFDSNYAEMINLGNGVFASNTRTKCENGTKDECIIHKIMGNRKPVNIASFPSFGYVAENKTCKDQDESTKLIVVGIIENDPRRVVYDVNEGVCLGDAFDVIEPFKRDIDTGVNYSRAIYYVKSIQNPSIIADQIICVIDSRGNILGPNVYCDTFGNVPVNASNFSLYTLSHAINIEQANRARDRINHIANLALGVNFKPQANNGTAYKI